MLMWAGVLLAGILGQPDDMAGESRARIKPLAGNWEVTIRQWREPGDSPRESRAFSENSWILDRHFLQQELQGERDGKPYNGLGLLGYDAFREKYAWTWVDNTCGEMQTRHGRADDSGRVITLTGPFNNPLTEHTETARTVLRLLDVNEHVFDTYVRGSDGREFKMLELTFRRRGASSSTPQDVQLAGDLQFSESGGIAGRVNLLKIDSKGHLTANSRGGGERNGALSKIELLDLLRLLEGWKELEIRTPKPPVIVADAIGYSITYAGKTLVWHDAQPNVPPAARALADWLRAAAEKASGPQNLPR